MKRIGRVIGIRPECITEYKRIHAAIWPEIAQLLYDCNLRNYSIFLFRDQLFSYMEYVGEQYSEDMAKMASSEINQKWLAICKPMQRPDPERPEGTWWQEAEEVFHNRP